MILRWRKKFLINLRLRAIVSRKNCVDMGDHFNNLTSQAILAKIVCLYSFLPASLVCCYLFPSSHLLSGQSIQDHCQFIEDVLFQDFPVEVFLQRPSLLRVCLAI